LSLSGCAGSPPRMERIGLEAFRQKDTQGRLEALDFEYRERLLPTRFGATYALECGAKNMPLVVLFHAMGFNALTWKATIPALAQHYRVLAVDTIGDQGKSVVRRDGPKNGQEYAEWVSDILDAAGAGQATLIGCSMGGWIALSAALYHPGRVSALILNSPAAGIPVKTTWLGYLKYIMFSRSETKHRYAAKMLLGNGQADRDWEDYMVQVVRDPKGARLGFPRDYDAAELRRVDCPIQLLIGDQELIYQDPEALITEALKLWGPGLRVERIPQAAHMGHYDNPSFFNAAVLRFLKEELPQ